MESLTKDQFRVLAQQIHKSFNVATFHNDVDVYAVIVYVPSSVRRYQIVGMGNTMEKALEEALLFKSDTITELGIEFDPMDLPDLSYVNECLRKADESINRLWEEFHGKKDITIEETKTLFGKMDRHALTVGKAFFEATGNRYRLEDCLAGCGRGDAELGIPGWIPSQIRQMVYLWNQAKSANFDFYKE